MKRASYRDGVDFIAMNDEPTDLDPEDVELYTTVQMLAQLFAVPTERVAADVVRLRKRVLRAERRARRAEACATVAHPGNVGHPHDPVT